MNKEIFTKLKEIASERRTAKQYNPMIDVSKEELKEIYSFAKTAPHSMGIELVRIISVDRASEYRKGISEHIDPFNQEKAFMASDLAIMITKKSEFFDVNNEELKEIAIRGVKFSMESKGLTYNEGDEKGFINSVVNHDHANNGKNKEEWSARQAYIQLGYILLGAKTLGIETTAMEGFLPTLNDYLKENQLIKDDERVTLIVALGHIDNEIENPFIGNKQLRKNDDDYFTFI